MPSYTLHYFNQRGRAEICRMLFAAGGVQYTDKRYEMSEWNNARDKMPCCMMPMLDIDNKDQYPQTMSIARYLASEFGFHGRNNMDRTRIDYICDCFYDILDDYMRMFHDDNGRMLFQKSGEINKSSESYKRYHETCRRILPYMDSTLEMYNDGNQFFMGDQMTMADMMCYCCLENPINEDCHLLRSYPKLMALTNRVMNHTKLSQYLAKRFSTDF